MSEFHVEVVRVGAIEKHPNADTLSITMVHGGYPVCIRTGEFAEGDLAVYVPVDAIVPEGDPRWEFLGVHRRIRARRLRGVFSMGLLTRAEPDMREGDDVAERMRITKWEESQPEEGSADEHVWARVVGNANGITADTLDCLAYSADGDQRTIGEIVGGVRR